MPAKKNTSSLFIFGGVILLLILGTVIFYLNRNGEDLVVQPTKPLEEQVEEVPPVEEEVETVAVEVEEKQPVAVERNQVSWKVFGKVTAADSSTPILDAKLELFVDPDTDYRFSQKQAQTDGDGYYEFILSDSDVPQLNLAIGVRAENHAAKIESLVPRKRHNSLPDDIELNFELVPGKTLYGQVVERNETPVPNATVGLYRKVAYHGLRTENPNEAYPTATSDDNGMFELIGVPENQDELILIGRATGYVPGMVKVASEQTNDIELLLRPGEAMIRGTVYNEDGSPVPNVPMTASYLAKGSRPSFDFRQLTPNVNILNTKTDEKGTYEFPALLAGWQGVVAGHGQPVSRSVGDMIFLEQGDEKVLNLKFLPPLTINGVVLDRETQKPVAGVRISNVPRENSTPPMEMVGFGGGVGTKETITDFSGKFSIELDQTVEARFGMRPVFSYQPPAPYAMPDHSWIDYRLGRNETGEDIVVRVELDRPVKITGIVVQGEEETPVPGAGVSLTERSGRNFWQETQFDPPEVFTDSQGRFELIKKPGVRGFLVATTENALARKEFSAPAGTTEVDEVLVLIEYAQISGTITDSQGNPVPDINVRADQRIGGRGRRGGPGGPGGGRTAYHATTNETGFYTLEKVSPGGLMVSVDGGELFQSPDPQRVDVESGQYLENIDFVLPAVASFEGYVVDEDDQPIEGAVVTQSRSGRRMGPPGMGQGSTSVETDANGYYKFDNLSVDQGLYRFTATHSSYEEATIDERVLSDSPLTITMVRRPRVEFVVYKESGSQVTSFEYEINIDRNQSNWRAMNRIQRTIYAQSEPVVESLSVGNYTLHVFEIDATGEQTGLYGTETIAVDGGGEAVKLEVVLGAALEVTGVVKTLDDEPIEGATVELVRLDSPRGWGRRGGGEETTTDANGKFSFKSVESGSIRVEAEFEGMVQVEEHDLDISPETPPAPLEIIMSSGAVIYGTVIDVDGDPMVGALVSAGGGSRNETQVDENGEYRIEQIEPGTYTVYLRGATNSLLSQTSTKLDVDEQQEVNFNFVGMVDIHGGITTEPETRIPPAVILAPEETGEAVNLSVRRSGLYEARVDPQNYEILVSTMSGRVVTNSGQSLVVNSTPKRQTIDFTLRLEAVGVVIGAEEGELTGGTFTYIHENEQGVRTESKFKTDKTYFTIESQPHGRCWAEYRTDAGGEFEAAEWIDINESAEKILTLIPKGLLEE